MVDVGEAAPAVFVVRAVFSMAALTIGDGVQATPHRLLEVAGALHFGQGQQLQRIVVPGPAFKPANTNPRAAAREVAPRPGQPVIVENCPGTTGTVYLRSPPTERKAGPAPLHRLESKWDSTWMTPRGAPA